MRRRVRLTTRQMPLAVAVAALAVGGWREWHYLRLYRTYGRQEAWSRMMAERRERERVYCLEQDVHHAPYDGKRRVERFESDRNWLYYPSMWPEFTSWSGEAGAHAEWAATHRQRAEELAAKRREIRRYMILP
jgi:hypothetical protein